MAETGQFFDNVSVAAGADQTSDIIRVVNNDTLTVQLVGDGNATNIDIDFLTRANSNVPVFGNYDSSVRAKDLTTKPNNSDSFILDVQDVGEIRVKVTNQAASDSELSAYFASE